MTRSRDISQPRKALAVATLILLTNFALSGILPARAEAQSDDARGQVLTDRARGLASEGRCPEAIDDLERASAMRPADAEVALLHGQCLIATQDYVQASQVLAVARENDALLQDVDVYLGVALYHVGDYAQSWDAFRRARGNVSTPARADYELYTGLLLLERGEPREAALALERARLADPEHVEPVASYYAGVAWQGVGEHELARENLRRTIEVDGRDGAWGSRAAALLEGESLADRSFGGVYVGLEYDTNVTLRSLGIALPAAISDESDGRVVWGAHLGAELFRAAGWSGGVAGSYTGNAHFHLNQFNSHYPVGTVWLDRDLTEQSFLRARYDIGYGWLALNPFVLTQAGTLEWHRNWGRYGNTEVAALWDWYKFQFDTAILAEPPDPALSQVRDRSGQGFGGALRHRILVPALHNDVIKRFEANGSYTLRRYWATGDDWDYYLHDLRLGFESVWPWKIGFDVWGSAAFMPFDNISSYAQGSDPLVDRKDFIGQVHAEVERPINDVFSVSGRYHYLRNESNVTVFDYSRHVVGAYLNARF